MAGTGLDGSPGPTRGSVSDSDTQALGGTSPAAPVRVASLPSPNAPRGLGAVGGRGRRPSQRRRED